MKHSTRIGLMLAVASLAAGSLTASALDSKPWKDYNKGVRWAPSLKKAKAKALKKKKLLMHFLNTGDVDRLESC